jgi:hypothetical protein
VKYGSDGAILTNPDGIPLAGAIGKGGAMGCVPCHSAEADYVLSN